MAISDGALAENEIALLIDRCDRLGLGESELRDAIAFGLSDAARVQFPTEPDQQQQLLRDLICMMAADGKLEESEKRLFALAAAKMKIEGEHLHQIIDEAIEQRRS